MGDEWPFVRYGVFVDFTKDGLNRVDVIGKRSEIVSNVRKVCEFLSRLLFVEQIGKIRKLEGF